MNALAAQSALAVLCLGAVVLLILGTARAARAIPALRAVQPEQGAIAVRACLALDRQRRLHLVEAPGCRLLVLTGGTADAIITLPSTP